MPLRDVPASFVQAPPPADGGGRRRVHVVSFEQVHPVIRIAHRRRSPDGLRVADRVIFDHEVVLIERGRGRLVTEQGSLSFEAGDILFIGPFIPHRFEAEADEDTVHVAVHFDLAPQAPGDDDRLPERRPYEVRFPRGRRMPALIEASQGQAVAEHLRRVVSLREADDDLSLAEAGVELHRALLMMLRRGPTSGAPPEGLDARQVARLERAVAWIEANLRRDISVADVAEVADFSASHLNRLFIEWTGQTPKAYIRRARIELARKLLADVDLSIKEVAYQAGFSDPYHFSRTFRQVDGLSPTLYREALHAGRREG